MTVFFGLGTVDTPSLQERIQARDDPKEVYIHRGWNGFKPFDQKFFEKHEMPCSLPRVNRSIETEVQRWLPRRDRGTLLRSRGRCLVCTMKREMEPGTRGTGCVCILLPPSCALKVAEMVSLMFYVCQCFVDVLR